ncbi:hypothetical protein Tco_1094413 [Tanacetum coccineum]|uniref:Uncharacterized protein n=1 Tax=Tanacetum coccineum TaxID=301880 RepID=A0ABQ5IGN4_9ASTR
MAELISEGYIVNAQNESKFSITSNDINMELNKEFLVKLHKNAYHGWIDEDVMDHIAKVLEMIDLIYIPGVDSHQLRMKVLPLSLAADARQCWNKRRMDDSILNNNNITTDSFFKPYLITRGKCDTEKEDEQSQTKRKYRKTSINEQPNTRMCKAETFKAIQYSLETNEEYIAIRRCEYDIWERNEDNMSKIYQDLFQKKDNGWMVTRIE